MEKKENELIALDGSLTSSAKERFIQIELWEKQIKKEKEQMREAILKEMEEKNIIKIDSDEVSITYKAPTYKEDFDKAAFKKDNEELYNSYLKISPVKASIMVKIKQ